MNGFVIIVSAVPSITYELKKQLLAIDINGC